MLSAPQFDEVSELSGVEGAGADQESDLRRESAKHALA